MTDSAQANYQLKVQQLRDNYLIRTRASLEHLQHYLQRAQHGDAVAQQEMLMMIHRTSGSGAMLGFIAVSNIAREIESRLRGGHGKVNAEQWQAIQTGVLQLHAALLSGNEAET